WYAMANRNPATYDIEIEDLGEGWIAVGQGEPGADIKDGKTNYKTFSMKMPAIYWSLTVLKAKKVSETIDGRELIMWSPRVPEARMALQSKLYAPIIALFDKSFAKFPFTRYGALDSPSYGGGALEAYSYATYGGGLPDEDAHEPSHTWFGGILPNTYLKSFWNESFAVWCQDFYQRNVQIGNNLDRQEAFSTVCMPGEEYNQAPLMKSGAAIGPAAGALGYGKGALVLNMLEQLIGTQNMVECVRDWFKNHPVGEPAEWEDFEKVVLRRMSGHKLQDFFDDWFRRPGFANVDLVEGSVANGTFKGRLRWNGPKFRMPLEIWFRNSGNGDMRRNLDTLDCDAEGRFSIPLGGFRPDRVYLDPRHRALRTGDEPTFGSFDEGTRRLQVVRDAARPDYMERYQGSSPEVTDPAGKFLIGHPSTMPILKELCLKAGFGVNGDTLIYQGLTVNLKKSAAVAVIDLGGGKKCAIAIGTCKMRPNIGHAYQGVVDDLGRLLKGKTGFVTNAQPLMLK
ncbi:MAG TPA: M1 family aminopeptidase, partial [Fimbriimonas sp.]|nr:M1 family aminopeptidase [Fimbriimonas sp.]